MNGGQPGMDFNNPFDIFESFFGGGMGGGGGGFGRRVCGTYACINPSWDLGSTELCIKAQT